MARKAVSDGEKSKTVAVRLGVSDYARLVAVAEKFGKSTTDFARMVLLAAANGSEEHERQAAQKARTPKPITSKSDCDHKWENKGWATICSKCREVKS